VLVLRCATSPVQPPPVMAGFFEVSVSREDIKFHCAHFVAYKGFRERLHGHNYTLRFGPAALVQADRPA